MAKKSKQGPIETASRAAVEKMRARETPADPNKRWLAESDGNEGNPGYKYPPRPAPKGKA